MGYCLCSNQIIIIIIISTRRREQKKWLPFARRYQKLHWIQVRALIKWEWKKVPSLAFVKWVTRFRCHRLGPNLHFWTYNFRQFALHIQCERWWLIANRSANTHIHISSVSVIIWQWCLAWAMSGDNSVKQRIIIAETVCVWLDGGESATQLNWNDKRNVICIECRYLQTLTHTQTPSNRQETKSIHEHKWY